ncbi:Agamous MADS-box protein AGL86 [Spatholobus suberectus]|nr:Agamous MADS-box protein AGL86 [Spatholobus suberectus]
MFKRRVKLAFLTNESVRQATFRKKKRSIMKELREFKAAHGMEACAIVRRADAREPEIWASSDGLRKALMKSAQEQQRRRLEGQEESHVDKMIKEAKKKLMKLREENRKKELLIRMLRECDETGDCHLPEDITKNELRGLLELIDMHTKEIKRQLEELNDEPTEVQATVVAPPAVVVVKGGEGLGTILEAIDELKIQ